MLKKKERLYRARRFMTNVVLYRIFLGTRSVPWKIWSISKNLWIRAANGLKNFRDDFNKKAARYRENVIKTHRNRKRARSSGTSSKCDMSKTWRDHDERKRERSRPRSDDETALTVSTKRLMSTTASRTESLSRSLRNIISTGCPRALLPLTALLPFFSRDSFLPSNIWKI